MVRALAIDVGSSSVRTALVDERGAVTHAHRHRLTVATPAPGEVELDPLELATTARALAERTLADGGPCDAVGVTNQRATTIVFDPTTGVAVGPAVSWQDLRTVVDCLVLQGEGLRLAPNQTATKARWLLQRAATPHDKLRVATIDTWIAWHLSGGSIFVTDRSNASVTGLVERDVLSWDQSVLAKLGLRDSMLARLVDTIGDVGAARALKGSPPITALVGDQPASLFGQSRVHGGAKITLGTGAMLDVVHGEAAPASMNRLASGCYPTVVRSRDSAVTWGVEGIVLSAGSCVEWLVDLGVIATPGESEALAATAATSDGVVFVPALFGLGTPWWDFGARGAFFGLTRGSNVAHLVRAVLEGVAHRCADLVDAAEREVGSEFADVRLDGGMSANRLVAQRLADFSGRAVAVSSEREATTRGAGLMALVGAGHLRLDDVEGLWKPAEVMEPSLGEDERTSLRAGWAKDVERAARTIPELSAISF